jgi:hypothetical protein
MSWLFGFYSKYKYDVKQISNLHPKPILSFEDANCYIAVGGNAKLVYTNQADSNFKFFVCGLGISPNAENLLSVKDWQQVLNNYHAGIDSLNGHFCGALIRKGSVHLFTDKLGLREFHILENTEGWYFSTRLDWLLKVQKTEINFSEFSSRWLTMNQLSNKSVIKDFIRLNCGSKAVISKDKFEIKKYNWLPGSLSTHPVTDFSEKLRALILLGTKSNSKISLSLSGGLDSWLIFSVLLNSRYKNWDCHTFTTDIKMDSIIAKKILTDFRIPYHEFSGDVSEEDKSKLINELFEYIGSTYIRESAFVSRKLVYYNNLTNEELIIDGAFGEIWRREFLTKFYYKGKKYVEEENYDKIYSFLKSNRASLFNNETVELMQNGVVNQLKEIKKNLPSWREINWANWLDLFAIKTKLPNYFSTEQARIDGLVTAYMPFVQIGLFDELFNLPLHQRKNYRLFKKIILANSKELGKYDLVKGNTSYPFYLSPIPKRIYLKICSKLKPPFYSAALDQFLIKIKEFVIDSLLSNSAKTYSPYNYKEIHEKVNRYYKGETSQNTFVDWFITFEIFRQIVEGKN